MSVIPMEKISFVKGIASAGDMALELVTGHDAEDQPTYALLLLPANKVKDLQIALATKNVILEHYGKVLAKGDGHEPPEELVDDILGLLTRK